MYLIAFVCLFWAVAVVWLEPVSTGEWASLLIPAVLTIVIACDHVRLTALRKRVEALEQKLTEQNKTES